MSDKDEPGADESRKEGSREDRLGEKRDLAQSRNVGEESIPKSRAISQSSKNLTGVQAEGTSDNTTPSSSSTQPIPTSVQQTSTQSTGMDGSAGAGGPTPDPPMHTSSPHAGTSASVPSSSNPASSHASGCSVDRGGLHDEPGERCNKNSTKSGHAEAPGGGCGEDKTRDDRDERKAHGEEKNSSKTSGNSMSSPSKGPSHDSGGKRDGCKHYSRRCRIVAPCCGEVVWCRHCHRDNTEHELDRKAIKEVVCSICNLRQPSSPSCIKPECKTSFGNYFCQTCNFWDDDGVEKMVFHCDDCGICRIGGRENYFHCKTCGCCYPMGIKNSHKCVEDAMNQNCPVCLQDLFQSTTQVTILLCGHTIHQSCLIDMQRDYCGLQSLRCPICNASLYNYDVIWRELDRQVEVNKMPEEFRDVKVHIICNDCHQPSEVPFHIIGHKCSSCASYNTRRL